MYNEINSKRSETLSYQEEEVIAELQDFIKLLEETLNKEKTLNEKEIIEMNKAYSDKLINLRESEALKEFELQKLKKEFLIL